MEAYTSLLQLDSAGITATSMDSLLCTSGSTNDGAGTGGGSGNQHGSLPWAQVAAQMLQAADPALLTHLVTLHKVESEHVKPAAASTTAAASAASGEAGALQRAVRALL